jgi:hypothetical protein
MTTIPSHHTIGDPGHTDDHNAASDVLTDHENRLGTVEGLQPGYLVKTGGNTVTLTNPSGVSGNVVIPTGTRDPNAYVSVVTYGGLRTFGLDTYGQLRVGSAMDSTTPAEFYGQSATQTSDLTRWRKTGVSGAVVARIDANGNVFAPNITPGVWTNISLASGLVWADGLGAHPQYRVVGDCVELRGAIKKSNGTDFTASPQDAGTLPTAVAPPYQTYGLGGAQFSAGMDHVRVEVQTGGLIRFYFSPSAPYTPTWISLDNFRYSRTA